MVSNPLHVLAATATDGAPTTRPSTTATESALATSFHVRRISSSPLYSGGLGACPAGLLPPARSGQALSEDSALIFRAASRASDGRPRPPRPPAHRRAASALARRTPRFRP